MRPAKLRAILFGGSAFCAGLTAAAATLGWSAAQTMGLAAWLGSPWSTEPGALDSAAVQAAVVLEIALASLTCLAIAIAFERPDPHESDFEETRERLRTAGDALGEEMVKAVALLGGQIEKTDSHSAALEQGQRRLENSQNQEQVRRAILFLIAENREMRRTNEDYSRRLSDSRMQVEALREQLTLSNEISSRDSLTRAFSRKHFDSALARETAKADAQGGPLSLVMADIDGFKGVNDNFGHLVGDEVLRNVAELMLARTNDQDCVARFGGEEFAIILPGRSAGEAHRLADEIRKDLEGRDWRLKGAGKPLGRITASFGVAEMLRGESSLELVRRADAKLYRSKADGRNRVSL